MEYQKSHRGLKWLIIGPMLFGALVFVVVCIAVFFILSGPEPSEPVTAETTKAELEPKPEPGQAKGWNQFALDTFNYGTWAEGCTDPNVTWPCYVAGTDTAAEGTWLVTLQVAGDDPARQELGDDAAIGLLNLVGYEDDSLYAVQTVDADGVTIAIVTRGDSQLLGG